MSPLASKTAEGTRAPLCFRWLVRSRPAVTFPAPFGTEEGRRATQARGVPFWRPPKLRPDQRALARHLIEEGKSVCEVARTFSVHVATIYRCLHDHAAL